MKTFSQLNQEMHSQQSTQLGFCGKSDVELAELIYESLEFNFDSEDKNMVINTIAKVLEHNRTY
jgi:hypothetical protein